MPVFLQGYIEVIAFVLLQLFTASEAFYVNTSMEQVQISFRNIAGGGKQTLCEI